MSAIGSFVSNTANRCFGYNESKAPTVRVEQPGLGSCYRGRAGFNDGKTSLTLEVGTSQKSFGGNPLSHRLVIAQPGSNRVTTSAQFVLNENALRDGSTRMTVEYNGDTILSESKGWITGDGVPTRVPDGERFEGRLFNQILTIQKNDDGTVGASLTGEIPRSCCEVAAYGTVDTIAAIGRFPGRVKNAVLATPSAISAGFRSLVSGANNVKEGTVKAAGSLRDGTVSVAGSLRDGTVSAAGSLRDGTARAAETAGRHSDQVRTVLASSILPKGQSVKQD